MTNNTFKDILVDEDKKLCYVNNKPLTLTITEYKLLTFLIEHQNKIFTREELKTAAWDKDVKNRAVDATISKLRKKLDGKYITTRAGFGYGLIEE